LKRFIANVDRGFGGFLVVRGLDRFGGVGRGGWSEGLEREKAGSLAALGMTTRNAKATTRAKAQQQKLQGSFPFGEVRVRMTELR
jgi:hypothetical protein